MTGTAGRMSHHCQEDQGNFVYYFNGAPVVIDPGYYQPDARAHSVPQVQGWKQKRGLSSMLADYGQTDAMQWSVMNLSPTFVPTQPPGGIRQDLAAIASLSVWRTVVLCGTEILVLDDISSTASVSPDAQLQLQLGARPLGNGPAKWYVETASGAVVQFVTFGPEMKSPIVEARDFSGSWIFKQLQQSGQLAWHTLRCNYTTDSLRPLITIASPADALQSAPSEVFYSADMIKATFASGKTVRFHRTESRWKMDSSADQAGNFPHRPESQ
jgi:hypothetical protein